MGERYLKINIYHIMRIANHMIMYRGMTARHSVHTGCSSIFYALTKYLSRQKIKHPKLPEVWWTPGNEDSVNNNIRSYEVIFSEELVQDLKYRLKHTRPLTPPLKDVAWNYGTNTDALRKLLDYWADNYDFQERQKYINQYPHFKTNIQGLDIHFVRVRPNNPERKRVLPLLILHGWPGSIMEFYKMLPLLTIPRPEHDFIFEVIAPSLPGFGFSSAATIPGLSAAHMSVVLKNLMLRLGYNKFYVQGGDWGAVIVQAMSSLFPQHVLGMHSTLCVVLSGWILLKKVLYKKLSSFFCWKTETKERTPSEIFKGFLLETGYYHIQATKPDTVGVGLSDSPAGLAAYIIEKFSTGTNSSFKSRMDGGLLEKYTYDELIDNLMIYWISNSMTTAMRIYAEQFVKGNKGLANLTVKVPSACAQFPHEIIIQESDVLKERFVNLLRLTKMPRGGHFSAFEEPELLADDIWASIDQMETWHKSRNRDNRDL